MSTAFDFTASGNIDDLPGEFSEATRLTWEMEAEGDPSIPRGVHAYKVPRVATDQLRVDISAFVCEQSPLPMTVFFRNQGVSLSARLTAFRRGTCPHASVAEYDIGLE